MLLYFEFEDKRRKADVTWPKSGETIIVHLNEQELISDFPSDLYFTIEENRKVEFEIEDSLNERLLDLQKVIRRRLQEFTNKS